MAMISADRSGARETLSIPSIVHDGSGKHALDPYLQLLLLSGADAGAAIPKTLR